MVCWVSQRSREGHTVKIFGSVSLCPGRYNPKAPKKILPYPTIQVVHDRERKEGLGEGGAVRQSIDNLSFRALATHSKLGKFLAKQDYYSTLHSLAKNHMTCHFFQLIMELHWFPFCSFCVYFSIFRYR